MKIYSLILFLTTVGLLGVIMIGAAFTGRKGWRSELRQIKTIDCSTKFHTCSSSRRCSARVVKKCRLRVANTEPILVKEYGEYDFTPVASERVRVFFHPSAPSVRASLKRFPRYPWIIPGTLFSFFGIAGAAAVYLQRNNPDFRMQIS